MKFKNKQSPKSFFNFKGETKHCINWIYETEDKDEIKFLESNSNFVVFKVEKPKETVIDKKIEDRIKDIEVEEKEPKEKIIKGDK